MLRSLVERTARRVVPKRTGAVVGVRPPCASVRLLAAPTVACLSRHGGFQTFSQKDEDDLVRIIRTKPRQVLKHVRQQVWRSRKREIQFRNTVTQLMIVVQDHLRKQLLDPQHASTIMEGVLEECVKFGQHDMAHLLFRAFLRFRKYGCAISIDALRYLFESYKETDSSELMLQLANELKADPSLRAFCIAAYLFAGHAEEAEALKGSIPLNELSTDDMIAIAEGYAKLKLTDKIVQLVEEIPAPTAEEGSAPGSSPTNGKDLGPVFRSLLRVAGKLNHEALFNTVFQGAVSRNVTFTQDMFATILRYKMRHVASLPEIAAVEAELATHGYVADVTTNSIVISAYARLVHFGEKGSEEMILAKVDTLLSSIEARLKQGDPDADISTAHIRAVIRGYGAAGRGELIKQAWARMQHKDLCNDTRVYNEMLKWYALMGDVKDVLALKEEMEQKGINHDAHTYAWVFRALGKFYPRHTQRLHDEMRGKGIRPDISLYTTLLGIFGDLGSLERVEELFAEMKLREEAGTIQLTPSTFAVLMRVFADDLPRVDALYQEAVTRGVSDHPHIHTVVLHAYASHKDGGERLSNFLQSLPAWTADTYNVLLNMYGKQKNKEKVEELFEKMKVDEQVELNDVTYGTLVTAFARMKCADRVHEVVELLKSKEGSVSPRFYSVLAASLNRMGDAAGVDDAWEDLMSSKLFPDTEVYNHFLSLYGRQHNPQKMQTVLTSMMKHVPPNPVTSTTILDMLGKTGRIYEMESLFEEMKRSPDTQPTSVTYHQVLNAFAKSGDVAKMEKVREEMLTHGFTENAVTFNILADGYGRAKRFEQMHELLRRRKDANIPMDELGYCVLIAAYGKAKLSAELQKVVEELRSVTGASSCITPKVAWSFVDAFCRCHDVQSMEHWIQEIAALSPNGQLSPAQEMVLIGYFSRVAQQDKVDEIVKRLEEQGHDLTYSALNALAKGYAKAGQFEKVVGVLHKMRDRNFVPDSSTTLTLSNAFLRAGLHEQAQQVVEWRRQYARFAGASDE